ncbi:hypothetical protein [Novosphingobium sp. AP12]|uniref:hypothetical protein n=1 Tax=Novosphingobium sp. AP12 TaxID=1144305 RepID=UPI0002721A30|nr:hypothetical protein [Novosphingobium sp. AP12]EJL23694.1 hypothetical protein PMI02_04037 [Novosphingobium sp. AP12]
MTELESLRCATEDEVIAALEGAYVSLPITTPAALLEAFNLIIDQKLGQTAGDGVMWPGLRRPAN